MGLFCILYIKLYLVYECLKLERCVIWLFLAMFIVIMMCVEHCNDFLKKGCILRFALVYTFTFQALSGPLRNEFIMFRRLKRCKKSGARMNKNALITALMY